MSFDRNKPTSKHSRRRAVEAIDACRPSSDDLHTAELAWLADHLAADHELQQLYERSQRFDAAVASTFQNVPVPPGLEERLLARLGQEMPQPTDAVIEPVEESAPVRISWHRWLRPVAAAACIALITGGVMLAVWWSKPDGQLTAEDVLGEVFTFHRGAAENGHEMLAGADAAEPPTLWVTMPADVQPQQLPARSLLGRTGERYELPDAGGREAWLYVLPLPADARSPKIVALPAAPDRALFATGGFALTAWQEDGRLLVLVVEGDRNDLRSMLRQRGPVAWHSPMPAGRRAA